MTNTQTKSETLVWVGCKYKAVKSVGKSFEEGKIYKACMYGRLFLEMEDGETGFYYSPTRMVKLIDEGKIILLDDEEGRS
jgi:hypothetical protein